MSDIDRLLRSIERKSGLKAAKPRASGFTRWFLTFLDEKGIDLGEGFEVKGKSGDINYMSYQNVVDAILRTSAGEQAGIKDMIVKIDFRNGDVRHYLRHLAQAIAI